MVTEDEVCETFLMLRLSLPDLTSIARRSDDRFPLFFRFGHGSDLLSSQSCLRNLSFEKFTATVAHIPGKRDIAIVRFLKSLVSILLTCFKVPDKFKEHIIE